MGGGRAAPVQRVNNPKKTGARSARARTRGQNPLVIYSSNICTVGSNSKISKKHHKDV
jgi:hypothetical protein